MFDRIRSIFGARRKDGTPATPRDIFLAEVEAIIRALPGVASVRRVPNEFALDVGAGNRSHRFYLDNAFAETREMSPEQRRERIVQFFGSVCEPRGAESWDEARGALVPVLRGATYGMELWVRDSSVRVLRRPFVPYVDCLAVVDRPTSMSYVSAKDLAGWGVTESDVFEAMNEKFPILGSANVEKYDDANGPLWIVTSNDAYEPSRLLVPGWLASFRGRVQGNPIAIMPERSTLMIGGDGDPSMIERLLDKAEREFVASTRRISPALYTVTSNDHVVPYVGHFSDALAAKARMAQEKLAMYEHEEQKGALDKLYEQRGPDVFVASYQLFQKNDGPLRSLSVWTRGVRSYLPRTERVVLLVLGEKKGDKPKVNVEVPFEAIVGRLTPVPDLHPARFETTGAFPTTEELLKLQSA
jgi:hypothetical protein